MKIWNSYGSEHSANLVMIGHFQDVQTATQVKKIFDEINQQAAEDHATGEIQLGGETTRYSKAMMQILNSLSVHSIGPSELEQFLYEVTTRVEHTDVVLTTDENDISAFLKIMIDRGARIEVFSAHHHKDGKSGR